MSYNLKKGCEIARCDHMGKKRVYVGRLPSILSHEIHELFCRLLLDLHHLIHHIVVSCALGAHQNETEFIEVVIDVFGAPFPHSGL